MAEISFVAPNKIVAKAGCVSSLHQFVTSFDVSRIIVVTDKGIIEAGILGECLRSLGKATIEYNVFSEVSADPSESIVVKASEAAKEFKAELVVGLGGGSSMDVAKVVSVLAHPNNNNQIQDLYGVDAFTSQRLPLVLIPTTAGTGSEVTPISIITTGETTKSGIVSHRLLPDLALLDAELTLGLPKSVTAATGIDAMVHAIEAYTGKVRKNPISDMYATKALALLARNISVVSLDGQNIQARENMLLGSMLAGQAFANSPVGAVHALAYPLGGHFHIPHGLSNTLVLTEVMKFNLMECADLYAQLAPIITGDNDLGLDTYEVSAKLIKWLELLIKSLGLPTKLSDCGVTQDCLPKLAEDAMKQQRLLVNNPREMTFDVALDIYSKVF